MGTQLFGKFTLQWKLDAFALGIDVKVLDLF